MAFFSTLAESLDNPPETWQIVKRGDRLWNLVTKSGGVITSELTRKACEAHKVGGFWFNLYHDEVRWMQGSNVRNWRPYADIVAERERAAARRAERGAANA